MRLVELSSRSLRLDQQDSEGRDVGSLELALVAVVILVGLSYWAIHKIRPQVFKIDAGLTKWIWFKIEIRSPQEGSGRTEPPRAG